MQPLLYGQWKQNVKVVRFRIINKHMAGGPSQDNAFGCLEYALDVVVDPRDVIMPETHTVFLHTVHSFLCTDPEASGRVGIEAIDVVGRQGFGVV